MPAKGISALAEEPDEKRRSSRLSSRAKARPGSDADDDEEEAASAQSARSGISRLNRSFRNRSFRNNGSMRRQRLVGLGELALGRDSPANTERAAAAAAAAPHAQRIPSLTGGSPEPGGLGALGGTPGAPQGARTSTNANNRRGSVAAALAGWRCSRRARRERGWRRRKGRRRGRRRTRTTWRAGRGRGGPGEKAPMSSRLGGLLASFSDPALERRFRSWCAARHRRRAALFVASALATALLALVLCSALAGRALAGPCSPTASPSSHSWRSSRRRAGTGLLVGVLAWLAAGLPYTLDPLLYAALAVLLPQAGAALLGLRAATALGLAAAACAALVVEAAAIPRLREMPQSWRPSSSSSPPASLPARPPLGRGRPAPRVRARGAPAGAGGGGAGGAAVAAGAAAGGGAGGGGGGGEAGPATGTEPPSPGSRKPSNVVVTPMEVVMRRINDMREEALAEGADAVADGLEAIAELIAGTGSNLFAPSVLAVADGAPRPSSRTTTSPAGSSPSWPPPRRPPSASRGRRCRRCRAWRTRGAPGGAERAGAVDGAQAGPPAVQAAPLGASLSGAPELQRLLAGAFRWDFDTMALDAAAGGHGLRVLASHALRETGLAQRLGLPAAPLERFLEYVELDYQPNSYHNATHACDVLQAALAFLAVSDELRAALSDRDLLAAIVAAVTHDMGHEGRNNNFEIATASERALVYNDRSVLENYHASRCFQLLRLPECDFTAALPAGERRALRRAVVGAVLATDISHHFDNLGAFRARSVLPEFGASDDDRQILLNMLLKCADLGNAARPLRTYMAWAGWVMDEFWEQGDEERRRGLPLSPWMDREKPEVGKCQSGFIDFLVEPLYSSWAACFPAFQPHLALVRANRAHWRKVEEGELAPAGPAPRPARRPPRRQRRGRSRCGGVGADGDAGPAAGVAAPRRGRTPRRPAPAPAWGSDPAPRPSISRSASSRLPPLLATDPPLLAPPPPPPRPRPRPAPPRPRPRPRLRLRRPAGARER
eukprot:tig00000507_g1786.t1